MENKKSKVTVEIKNIIKEKYISIGCYTLAKELKLDPKTVYRYAKIFNLPNKSRKGTAKFISIICSFCEKEFLKNKYQIKSISKHLFCNIYCLRKFKHKNKILKEQELIELAKQGFSNKEISLKINRNLGSVVSGLNRANFRRDYLGESSSSIRCRFRKIFTFCLICGFDRFIDMAHIIPACKGGSLDFNNLIPLCPNHHHAFDHQKLTKEEETILQEKIILHKSLYCGEKNV